MRRFEKCFAVLVMLLSMDAILPLIRRISGVTIDEIKGDPLAQVLFSGVYLLTLVLVVIHRRRVGKTIKRDPLLWLLVILAVASTAWSTAPGVTGRRAVALLGTTLVGVFLASRFSVKEIVRLACWALGIAAALSFASVLLLPKYAIETGIHAGAWRGVFVQKNILGRSMALSVVMFTLYLGTKPRRRWIPHVLRALSVLLMLGSQSKTALVITVVLLAVMPFYRSLQKRHSRTAPMFAGGLLLGASASMWALSHVDSAIAALGRDTTLSGRTALWSAVQRFISQRPFAGYGYGGFWVGPHFPSADLWRIVKFQPAHAHNGYLDLALDLGMLGVAIFAALLVRNLVRGGRLVMANKSPEMLFPIVFVTFILLYNFTESAVLKQNSLYWILFVAASLAIPRRARSARAMPSTPVFDGRPLVLERDASSDDGRLVRI